MCVRALGGVPLTLPVSHREPLGLNLEPVAGQPERQPEPPSGSLRFFPFSTPRYTTAALVLSQSRQHKRLPLSHCISFFSVRWAEAIGVHWTPCCFSVRLLSKTCFCWRPVNVPSSVKIKCSTWTALCHAFQTLDNQRQRQSSLHLIIIINWLTRHLWCHIMHSSEFFATQQHCC